MNIIFLTLIDFKSYSEHNIYCDLLREFINNGHQVYCISPAEKRTGIATHFEENGHLLKLKIGNTQKTNILEKGISTLMLESQFIKAIKKHFSDTRFDLILYSTPPITLAKAVNYIKKRDGARTYLLLKDIFPQNAVDLGMMHKTGVKGLIYRYFRKKEKKLYALSDRIGCMSQANVDYILKHNPEIPREKVEVCPNSIEPMDVTLSEAAKIAMREKYGIPTDKKVFVYGGNLGKPQGIPFIIECLKAQLSNDRVYFLIIGDGTEFSKLQAFFDGEKPRNMKLMKRIPKEDYDRMIAACDVGLVFLDYRFTIPNFPSRLLSYMQAGLPVIACTDPNSDIGNVITDGGFGWWCESKNQENFSELVNSLINIRCDDYDELKENAIAYLKANWLAYESYKIITSSISEQLSSLKLC